MEKKYDAIIVGGGPAGLSAAIYLARAQFNVLVVERDAIGGQIVITGEVVNYPGILATNGKNLTADMHRQAENFGATFLSAEVTGLELSGTYKTVHTTRGDFSAPGIIYAAGAHPRAAGFKGEEDFKGHGVAYCATCDGEFFTDKDIFVVGGGFAAVEEGLFLTRYARRVFMVVRRDDFSIHSPAVDELKSHEKVTVLTHTKIKEVLGNEAIRSVILENTDRLEKKVKSLLYLNRLDYISGQIGDETCSMKELIEHIVFQLTAMHSQIEILTDLQDSSFKGKKS